MALPVRLNNNELQFNCSGRQNLPIDLLLELSKLAGNVGSMAVQHRGIT